MQVLLVLHHACLVWVSDEFRMPNFWIKPANPLVIANALFHLRQWSAMPRRKDGVDLEIPLLRADDHVLPI